MVKWLLTEVKRPSVEKGLHFEQTVLEPLDIRIEKHELRPILYSRRKAAYSSTNFRAPGL